MINIDTIKKIDSQGMHKVYDKWPNMSTEAYNSEHEQISFSDIDNIIFVGMGGSGTIGDMFASILSKTKMHFSIVKGYHLPNTVDSNTLVVATSISGNTVETLTVLDSAKKLTDKVIAISSGGEMEKYCKNVGIDFRRISQQHSARASLPIFLYSLLKILKPILPIKENDIRQSLNELKNLQSDIATTNLDVNNPALNIANWINGIALIYYPWGLNAAAIRFKNSLQENAKTHALVEDVIEACHNGIVSWERPSIIQPILLEGKDDYFKTKERWKILKEYFIDNKIDYKEVFTVNGSILSKLINLIYLLDYASIYCAILSNVDPSPVNSIDFIKKKLN